MEQKNPAENNPAFAVYSAWRASRIARLPTFDQWLAKRAAKLSDDKIARRLARMQENAERRIREERERLMALAGLAKSAARK